MSLPISAHGLVAAYESPGQLVDAARELRNAHYTKFEAYSPYPIHELDDIIQAHDWVPLIVLVGGLLGAATAWSMQTYIAVFDYPLNVGGRPLYSWPSFIVILFELTVLCASLFAFFGTLILCGFPRVYQPIFSAPRFSSATSDLFFLSVDARDPVFEGDKTAELLNRFDPIEVTRLEVD